MSVFLYSEDHTSDLIDCLYLCIFSLENIFEIASPVIQTDQCWPTPVKCEMNISAWRNSLIEFGLLEKYGYLLVGFEEGFYQGIPDHSIKDLKWFCPPNHSSALQVKDKIEKNFNKEVNANRLFGPYDKQTVFNHLGFFRSSPLGAVKNGDKSFRPINDLSFPRNNPLIPSVNSFVDKDQFETTWDDFKVVSKFLRNLKDECLIGIFDWEGAYRQIPTHPSQWRYLVICDFNDMIYVDTRIAFGGVAGCGSFGGPADGWKEIMKAKFNLLHIFRWVDDNFCIKLKSSDVSMLELVKASELLGVKTNSTKYSEFSDQQSFIGFQWNISRRTVGLSAEKLLKRRIELDAFWTKLTWKKNELERMNGKLNHLTLILPQMKPYLTANFRWLASWSQPSSRKAPEDVLQDMAFWRQTLTTLAPTRLIPDQVEWNLGWVGDASSEFGIGVIIGKRWAQFQWLPGWNNPPNGPRRTIAWAETVAVRLGLIIANKLHNLPGRTVSVLSDNTTTNGAAKNFRSKDFWVNKEWKIIQSLLIKIDCNPLHYVKSADNEADRLSRGEDPSKKLRHCFLVEIPIDLRSSLVQIIPENC